MTEGKLTVTETGFLNVRKKTVNLNVPIQSVLDIEIRAGGGIFGKSALVLDQDMENGVTGELIRLNNAGTITSTENRPLINRMEADARCMGKGIRSGSRYRILGAGIPKSRIQESIFLHNSRQSPFQERHAENRNDTNRSIWPIRIFFRNTLFAAMFSTGQLSNKRTKPLVKIHF